MTTRPERSLPSISDVYLIDPGGAPSQPPPANEIDAPREEEVLELDDGDFCEVYSEEPDLGVDVDVDFDLEATYALPPPVRYEPTTARYLVSMGEGRGQLSLRALAPGEPPPFGEPIAMLSPSCSVDTRTIEAMLNR